VEAEHDHASNRSVLGGQVTSLKGLRQARFHLTAKQQSILEKIAVGDTTQEMAVSLHVSAKTSSTTSQICSGSSRCLTGQAWLAVRTTLDTLSSEAGRREFLSIWTLKSGT
jgi:FixJ family two-component response regulator